MSIENPPIFNTSIFNDLAFDNFSDGLSLEEADNRYLKLTGGFLSGTLSLKDNLLITRITNGEVLTATNGAVNVGLHLLSSSSHIGNTSNHNFNIQANNTNILQIQPSGNINILSGGLIANSNVPVNIFNAGGDSNYQVRIDAISGNIDLRNNNSGGVTLLSLVANGSRQLTCINNANLVNIPNHNGSTSGLQLAGTLITATAAELNYVDITTAGIAEANKALILNSSRNITNINNISSTGTITNSFTNNTTNLISYQTWTNDLATDINVQLYMSNIGSSIGTSSNHPFRILANNSNHLVCDGSGNVNILNHNGTVGLQLNSVLVTASATELNYNDITTIGVAEASKALILDASRNISNINDITLSADAKIRLRPISGDSAYITSTASSNIIFYSPSGNGDSFIFDNQGFGVAPFYLGGIMQKWTTGFTNLRLDYNQNQSPTPDGNVLNNFWKLRSSGSWANIILSPNATDAIQCLASDSTCNIPIGLKLNKSSGTQLTLCDAKGSNSYLDGSYNRFLRFEGANANPVIFELQVNSGAATTASNAAYFGTISANQLRFGTDNTTRMCITETGRVGIGTNSPAANLHVSGSTNVSLGVSLQTVYQFDVSNGTSTITNLGSAPVTTAVSAVFSSFINCSGIKQVSDGRLKTNIKNLDLERAKKLYNINAVNYNWIKDPDSMAEIGLIAQDVMDQGLVDLVAFSINEELKADEKVLKDGVALNIRYDRITCYLLELVKDQNNRINKLENIISNLDIVEE